MGKRRSERDPISDALDAINQAQHALTLAARAILRVKVAQARTEVSVTEAAEILGVSDETIRKRIDGGQIEARREPVPGGFRWMIDANALEAYTDALSEIDRAIEDLRGEQQTRKGRRPSR